MKRSRDHNILINRTLFIIHYCILYSRSLLMSIFQVPGHISRKEHLPLHKSSRPFHQSSFITLLRKPRQQATFIAALAILLLTVYISFLYHWAGPGSQMLPDLESTRSNQISLILQSIHKHGTSRMTKTTAGQVHLTKKEELAAVSSFLASLSSRNHIPLFVDPSSPIDPQLILDFDTRAPWAAKEVQAMVDDVWSRNPVFLYSKVCASPEVPRQISWLTSESSNSIILQLRVM